MTTHPPVPLAPSRATETTNPDGTQKPWLTSVTEVGQVLLAGPFSSSYAQSAFHRLSLRGVVMNNDKLCIKSQSDRLAM